MWNTYSIVCYIIYTISLLSSYLVAKHPENWNETIKNAFNDHKEMIDNQKEYFRRAATVKTALLFIAMLFA